MNKLLVITVLVALLAINAESFRVARQVDDEEGTVTKVTTAFRNYYVSSVDTVSGYLESIRGLKLEEKAKNLYDDTTKAIGTYYGVIYDQLYHTFYSQQ